MKHLFCILISILLILGCGKVTNETSETKKIINNDAITTYIGSIEIKNTVGDNEIIIVPSVNQLVISLGYVNKDGSQTILAWGKGIWDKATTTEIKDNPFMHYKTRSFDLEENIIKGASEESIYIKRLDGDNPKWEYYIKNRSQRNAIYFVNFYAGSGETSFTIPFDGIPVSSNTNVELGKPSEINTFWSRVYLYDESENIVKKSKLNIDLIKKKYNEDFYKLIKYSPRDIRVKDFDLSNPRVFMTSTVNVVSYLSKALNKLTNDPANYQKYIATLPIEYIPTPAIEILKTYKAVAPPPPPPAARTTVSRNVNIAPFGSLPGVPPSGYRPPTSSRTGSYGQRNN